MVWPLSPSRLPVSYAGVRSSWPPKPDQHEAPMFGGRGRVLAVAPSTSQQGEGGEPAAPRARPPCLRTGPPPPHPPPRPERGLLLRPCPSVIREDHRFGSVLAGATPQAFVRVE